MGDKDITFDSFVGIAKTHFSAVGEKVHGYTHQNRQYELYKVR